MTTTSGKCPRIDPKHIRELTCDEIKNILDTNIFLNLGVCKNSQPYSFPMSYHYKKECHHCEFTMEVGICDTVADIVRCNDKVVLTLNRTAANGVLNVTVIGTAKVETEKSTEEGCCGKKKEKTIIRVTSSEVTGRKLYFFGC